MRSFTGEGITWAPPGTIEVALLLKSEVDAWNDDIFVDLDFGFLGVFH